MQRRLRWLATVVVVVVVGGAGFAGAACSAFSDAEGEVPVPARDAAADVVPDIVAPEIDASVDTGDTGAPCVGSGCPTVIATTIAAVAIALAGAEIFIASNAAGGVVHKCPVAGCPDPAAPPVVVAGRPALTAIAAANADVFWTEMGAKTIHRCASASCTVTHIEMNGAVMTEANDLAIDETNVYANDTSSQVLLRCPYAAPAPCSAMTNINGGQPQRLAARAGTLFYTGANGEVRAWGGPPSGDLVTGSARVAGVRGLAADPTGQTIYFVNRTQNQVLETPYTSQGMPQVLTTAPAPELVAVDEQRIYWTSSGAIATCLRSSCNTSVTPLAVAARPSALRIDAGFVYWAALGDESNGAGAGVFRVAKP